MVPGWKFPINDAVNMLEKLPAVQKFLLFLSKNVSAVLLLLLAGSITANVYLLKEILHISQASEEFKTATIDYERTRGEKLEEILHQEIKREVITKRYNNE
jgi:hypothetical protein